MSALKQARAVGVTLVVLWVLIAVLWRAHVAGIASHYPVFFYLLPIALVAIAFGSLPAMLCAAGAIGCASVFLYKPLEWGDFVFPAILVLIGFQCAVILDRWERTRPQK